MTQMPELFEMFSRAGIRSSDAARLLGISRSYYSHIKHSRRNWYGVYMERVAPVIKELETRRDAMTCLIKTIKEGGQYVE